MKIAEIRAVQPPTPGAPQDWRTQLGQIVVEIRTDEGLCGIGVGGGGAAGIHVVQTVLRDLLLGHDAADVEGLHAAMCRHTAFYGRKGLVVMALSGVDLALWDLRGKAAGVPVAKLLNPQVDLSRRIDTYCTVWSEADVASAIESGHGAVKLHVESVVRTSVRTPANQPRAVAAKATAAVDSHVDVDTVVAAVRRVRESLGADQALMVDAFAHWDVPSTLRIAEQLAPLNVDWLEEPLPPDDEDGYAQLAAGSPVPIAGGEHEYLAEGFRHLIKHRLHAVLQPDINWCGGLTTLAEIYQMAKEAGLRVCPHRGSEAFALHAIAALDPQPLAESPRKWFTCLKGAPRIDGGKVHVPNAPGFGVWIDDALWQ